MKKLTIDVTWMHCKSCEILLEKSIQKIKNVEKVHASQSKWTVEVSYNGGVLDENAIKSLIIENGYKIGKEGKLPWFHSNTETYLETASIVVILIILYLGFKMSGFSFGGFGNISSPSFWVAFLVGITAGLSSCMALVWGLILGVSAKWNEEHIHATRWHRFEPHLYFNIGRIVGFGALGWILGIFGSFVSLSPFAIGTLLVITGFIMLLLGVNLSELSPRLSRVSITLPRFFGSGVASEWGASKHTVALTTGALTFFLPCGFTLAMQAYAITTGSFTTGALTMMMFAMGTAPGLLWVGGLTSYISGTIAKKFFRFMGVVVLLLAIFNISNGYTLMNLGGSTKVVPTTGVISDEVQEIRMNQSDSGYTPNTLSIKPNMKTRWIITSTNPYTCASQLIVPAIGVTKQLEQGENIIEFISPASGTINFSCSMGMYSGKIIIDAAAKTWASKDNSFPQASAQQTQNIVPQNEAGTSCGGEWSSGGCGGCEWGSVKTPTNTVSADTTLNTNNNANIKIINLTYTSNGLSGNIDVKKWESYKIIIDVKDTISGCMHMIVIPWLDENIQSLDAGTTIVFNIKPTQTGSFPLVCGMGVPHGYINVE